MTYREERVLKCVWCVKSVSVTVCVCVCLCCKSCLINMIRINRRLNKCVNDGAVTKVVLWRNVWSRSFPQSPAVPSQWLSFWTLHSFFFYLLDCHCTVLLVGRKGAQKHAHNSSGLGHRPPGQSRVPRSCSLHRERIGLSRHRGWHRFAHDYD